MEVFGKSLRVLLSATAWRSHEENAFDLGRHELFHDIIKRIFGTSNDNALKQVFKKLIYLVVL